jgi:hypothetical protein
MLFFYYLGLPIYLFKEHSKLNSVAVVRRRTATDRATMVCNIQNYWIFGLCPTSRILETIK